MTRLAELVGGGHNNPRTMLQTLTTWQHRGAHLDHSLSLATDHSRLGSHVGFYMRRMITNYNAMRHVFGNAFERNHEDTRRPVRAPFELTPVTRN